MSSKTTINWLFNDICFIYALLDLIEKMAFLTNSGKGLLYTQL